MTTDEQAILAPDGTDVTPPWFAGYWLTRYGGLVCRDCQLLNPGEPEEHLKTHQPR